MKKLFTLACVLTGSFIISSNLLNSNPTGAPAGYSNSPADGQNCSNCHGGSASLATNNLTTNIPTSGYVPGTNYTITVNIAGGTARKGFQVSPQKTNGSVMGTLIAGTGSQILNSKYITHTAARSSNPAKWTFTWTAPAKGSGVVNFYGSFVNGYSNISTQMVSVNEENSSTNVNELATQVTNVQVFPNPTTEKISLNLMLNSSANVIIDLLSLDGKNVFSMHNNQLQQGEHQLSFDVSNIKSGTYLLRLSTEDNATFKKVIIQ
jgi:hypothetical protein